MTGRRGTTSALVAGLALVAGCSSAKATSKAAASDVSPRPSTPVGSAEALAQSLGKHGYPCTAVKVEPGSPGVRSSATCRTSDAASATETVHLLVFASTDKRDARVDDAIAASKGRRYLVVGANWVVDCQGNKDEAVHVRAAVGGQVSVAL